VPFGAYATPTIMGELRRYFRDHTWRIRVSRRAKDLRPSVNATAEELSGELQRSPRISEIAERMGIPEEAVIEALEANNAYRAHSLDQSIRQNPAVESNLDDMLNRQVIVGLLDNLRPRQRQILFLRYFEELSQAQIAERIGTSQVHVGRLIATSLAQLREQLGNESSAG